MDEQQFRTLHQLRQDCVRIRAAELRRWIQSGEYDRVLGGDYPRRDQNRATRITDDMPAAARTYRANFDRSEDPLIRTVRTPGRDVGAAASTVAHEVGDTVAKLGKRFGDWRTGAS
ncbi:hypothetical protein [Nocardia abscessus]|uniref:hypothetical protein n=1 Tax=Nocardia abscessus TaxID=120957 RepID=UPI003CC7D767